MKGGTIMLACRFGMVIVGIIMVIADVINTIPPNFLPETTQQVKWEIRIPQQSV